MRVSFNWLKDYVDIDMAPEALAERLTMRGLEVEGVEAVGQGLEDVIVAKILAVTPHPHADRLHLCEVDTGSDTRRVVCGAPNVREGALVPLALPGTTLPNGMLVQEATFKGIVSSGMLLAEDEMGLTEDHEGIMILSGDLSPGASLPDCLPVADWVFEVGVTPNRSDCNSVIGIAREIAALNGQRVRLPEIDLGEPGPPVDSLTRVDIEDPQGCPRYAAGIIQGVNIGPSPFWMRYRLHLAGMRAISNIVDVTNFVMLEMGQPLHAFDYHLLHENRIVVRRARAGESFTTLDGKTHQLPPEALLICDADRAVGLAGIMGGLNSEISADTRDVLLESAFFDPMTIRRGAKRLGIATEASFRFERCIDIEGVPRALKRALSLLARLCGGRVARGIIDNYPTPAERVVIDLRVTRTNRFLGTDVDKATMAAQLRLLEMRVEEMEGDRLRVVPPSFRPDLTREVDLVEEVARMTGYEQIPVTYPPVRPVEEPEAPELRLAGRVRSLMTGFGFSEIITYSFVPEDFLDLPGVKGVDSLTAVVRLLNPLSTEQSVLRTSLVPGVLATARLNVFYEERNLRLFEWGKVFLARPGEPLPLEQTVLAALMTGEAQSRTWYQMQRPVDYYDIKGVAEGLLHGLGVREPVFARGADLPWYAPETAATIHCSGQGVGCLGRIHPALLEAYELKTEDAYLLEIQIPALLAHLPARARFQSLPRFPAVYRDISLLVRKEVESARIVDIIRRTGGALVAAVRLFDLYTGEGIGAADKALAFRIAYRSAEGTLDGSQVNALHERIIDRIREETGGRLREG